MLARHQRGLDRDFRFLGLSDVFDDSDGVIRPAIRFRASETLMATQIISPFLRMSRLHRAYMAISPAHVVGMGDVLGTTGQ
jgi:hypothetical protein